MALPFILGLVIGGGVVYAYNNRDELQEQLKARSKDLKSGLKKGQEALGKVRDRAKNLAQSLSADESTQSTKATKTTKATKSTAPKTTRHRRVAKAQNTTYTPRATEATLISNSSN